MSNTEYRIGRSMPPIISRAYIQQNANSYSILLHVVAGMQCRPIAKIWMAAIAIRYTPYHHLMKQPCGNIRRVGAIIVLPWISFGDPKQSWSLGASVYPFS